MKKFFVTNRWSKFRSKNLPLMVDQEIIIIIITKQNKMMIFYKAFLVLQRLSPHPSSKGGGTKSLENRFSYHFRRENN